MFLNPAANPRPLRSEVVAEGSDAIGEKGQGREGLVEFGLQGARRDDAHAHPLGHDGLGDAVVAVDEGVAKAHLDRIDPEFGGKPIDRRLDRKVALRPTEAAEGAARHGGGVDRPAVDPGMRMRSAGDRQMGVPEHLVGRVVVAPASRSTSASSAVIVPSWVAPPDTDTAPVPLW